MLLSIILGALIGIVICITFAFVSDWWYRRQARKISNAALDRLLDVLHDPKTLQELGLGNKGKPRCSICNNNHDPVCDGANIIGVDTEDTA